MTLDIATHRTILFQILKDIYTDTEISPYLGFKGGTAALMFYGLSRFSVDLDFDLLDQSKEDIVFSGISERISKYGTIRLAQKKRFNLFWLLTYETGTHNVKVEVNRRQFGSSYEIKNYLGVPMTVMVKEDMFAHKLVAMYERIGKTSRDIYDVWFFLSERFPINKEIVEQRSGMSFDEFIDSCVEKLKELSDRHILDGVGELLSRSQKDWAKAKLKDETISLLRIRAMD
jgi:predicted nucleotidyltransferase component of viral defense system